VSIERVVFFLVDRVCVVKRRPMKPWCKRVVLMGAGVLCLNAVFCRADVIIGLQDWDTKPLESEGVGAWVDDNNAVTLTREVSGDGYLKIAYDAGAAEKAVTVQVPATELFAGGWDDSMWVEFNFWADEPNNTLQLVWSPADSTDVWGLTLAKPTGGGTPDDYRASCKYDEGWELQTGPTPDMSEFLNDLDQIDWIGLYIVQAGDAAESFGLDDLHLMVPEPAEWAFMGALVLLAGIYVLRGRRRVA
jgi:hypothetical protein